LDIIQATSINIKPGYSSIARNKKTVKKTLQAYAKRARASLSNTEAGIKQGSKM